MNIVGSDQTAMFEINDARTIIIKSQAMPGKEATLQEHHIITVRLVALKMVISSHSYLNETIERIPNYRRSHKTACQTLLQLNGWLHC